MTLTEQPSSRMVVFENLVFKNDTDGEHNHGSLSKTFFDRFTQHFTHSTTTAAAAAVQHVLAPPFSSVSIERQNSSESDLSLSKLDLNEEYAARMTQDSLNTSSELNLTGKHSQTAYFSSLRTLFSRNPPQNILPNTSLSTLDSTTRLTRSNRKATFFRTVFSCCFKWLIIGVRSFFAIAVVIVVFALSPWWKRSANTELLYLFRKWDSSQKQYSITSIIFLPAVLAALLTALFSSFHVNIIILKENYLLQSTVLEIFTINKDHSLANCSPNTDEIHCRSCSERKERSMDCSSLFLFIPRSKEQKCTKPQACAAGICTWNQRLMFFDVDTLDNLSLWIKLVDFDRNQDVLGEVNAPRLTFSLAIKAFFPLVMYSIKW